MQQHMLQTLLVIAHLDLHLGQQGDHRLGIGGVHTLTAGITANGAVDGAGVHIDNVQFRRSRLGQRALSRAAWPVHRHRIDLLHS